LLGSCPLEDAHAGAIEEAANGGGRVESMSERQLREFARTKRKGLPRKHRG